VALVSWKSVSIVNIDSAYADDEHWRLSDCFGTVKIKLIRFKKSLLENR